MGKWLARLAALDEEGIARLPFPAPDKTDRRGLVSVLAVGRERATEEVSGPRDGDDDEIPAQHARTRARLLRWGWPLIEADEMAERLARRDRDGDDRVSCAAECGHYRPGRCGNHGRAGLHTHELGRDLSGLLQRCPGFQSEG